MSYLNHGFSLYDCESQHSRSMSPNKQFQQKTSDQHPILRLFVNGSWHSHTLSSGTYEVGRARQCAISVDHPEVSRVHARLVVHPDGQVQLIDGDQGKPSRNGTFVKNTRISECWIHPGETIHFGSTFVAAHIEAASPYSVAYPSVPGRSNRSESPEELTTIVFTPDTSAQVEAAAQGISAEERIQQLEEQLARTQLELKQQQESFSSLYAEFENFRRRIQSEADKSIRKAKAGVLLEVLTIADNFDLAQQQVKLTTDQEYAIHNNYQAVYRLLIKVLKRMGIARIESVDKQFDPNLHEAIAVEQTDMVPDDRVLIEHQAGYTLDNHVIRPAKVTVAANQAQYAKVVQ